MESKRKGVEKQDTLITALVIVTSFIAFIGGFVLSEDINPKKYKILKSNDNVDVVVAGKSIKDGVKFEKDNVYPKKGNLSYNLKTAYYGIDDSHYYAINYGVNDDEVEITEYVDGGKKSSNIVTFNSGVVDIVVNNLDDDEKSDLIIFILEDGSVEYMKVKKDFDTISIGNKVVLPLVHDIVKYYQGISCNSETSKCYNDIYVQSSNGTAYSVNEYVG